MAPGLPLPLLTYRLSSPSFLETVITDAGHPVYCTETSNNTTSLYRCDPLLGLLPIANICWPIISRKGKCKDPLPAQIFMDGSSKSEDDLLRRNVLNTFRKFHIPGHPHTLKWKRVQGCFQCTTSSGALVAVYEPAILTAPARLGVFTPTLSGLPDPQGDSVSNLLSDYLLVTALLLLTHPEDWRGLQVEIPFRTASLSYSTTSYSTPVSPITSTYPDTTCSSPITSTYPDTTCSSPITSTYPDTTCSSPITSTYPHTTCSSPITTTYPHTTCSSPTLDTVHDTSDWSVAKEDFVDNYEPPPPYEEIQWTVRIRQPRAHRT